MRNRSTVVRFPVFNGYEVRIILAKAIARTASRLGADLSGAVAGYIYPTPERPKVAWIVFGLDPDEATVAHEASHAVRALLQYVGAKNDNETFAYHLDYLVGKIHKFMKRSKSDA
jgi:hypothetical protein